MQSVAQHRVDKGRNRHLLDADIGNLTGQLRQRFAHRDFAALACRRRRPDLDRRSLSLLACLSHDHRRLRRVIFLILAFWREGSGWIDARFLQAAAGKRDK
jgi:hypothetical protein